MKIRLLLESAKARRVTEPFSGADHGLAEGACPACGHVEPGAPAAVFKVAGCGKRPSQDDRAYEADAVALCCERRVGTLRAETGTLFGVREDEAVSRLGVRIY